MTGPVAQSVECRSEERAVIPKLLKMVSASPRLALYRVELGLDNMTGCGIMSGVWDVILQ